MKVLIVGSTNPLSIARMWYADRIGEPFEVVEDPIFDDMYKTVEPIYKEHTGHIKKIDCIEILDIKATESPSEAAADE